MTYKILHWVAIGIGGAMVAGETSYWTLIGILLISSAYSLMESK